MRKSPIIATTVILDISPPQNDELVSEVGEIYSGWGKHGRHRRSLHIDIAASPRLYSDNHTKQNWEYKYQYTQS